MKYHHHIAKLMERKLIKEEKYGKRKRYILTDSGIILALILDCFKFIDNIKKKS
jgi:predicted transcriptional regulator